MLPSETLQLASSSPSGVFGAVSLVSSASPTAVWVKLEGGAYHHLVELRGEEETAVLAKKLWEGLPLIGWLDGDRTQPMDVMLWRDNERGSLYVEISGEGREKLKKVVDMETNRGVPLYADVKLYTKSDGSVSYSVTMVMEDYTVLTLTPKGMYTCIVVLLVCR